MATAVRIDRRLVPQISGRGFWSPKFAIKTPRMTTETTYPKFGLDARIPAFLERFYLISDDENGATEYTKLFTDDVTFQFTSLRMSGIEGTHCGHSARC